MVCKINHGIVSDSRCVMSRRGVGLQVHTDSTGLVFKPYFTIFPCIQTENRFIISFVVCVTSCRWKAGPWGAHVTKMRFPRLKLLACASATDAKTLL